MLEFSEFSGCSCLILGIITFGIFASLMSIDDYEIPNKTLGAVALVFSVLFLYAGLTTIITCEQEKTAIGLLNNEIQVDTIAVSPQGKVLKVKLIDVK